jgi:hypothetical protein
LHRPLPTALLLLLVASTAVAMTDATCSDLRVIVYPVRDAPCDFIFRVETWCGDGLPRGVSESRILAGATVRPRSRSVSSGVTTQKTIHASVNPAGTELTYEIVITRNEQVVEEKRGVIDLVALARQR